MDRRGFRRGSVARGRRAGLRQFRPRCRSRARLYLAPSGNGGYDVASYDVSLTYRTKTHGIATATVDITASASQELHQFSLDARKGLKIDSVRVDDRRARFVHRGDKLTVRRFGVIAAGRSFTVTVTYSGDPRPVQDQSGRGTFGWLRTNAGAVTHRAHGHLQLGPE